MKFDFVIGNPPYQDTSIGENKTYTPPVYDKFLDAAYKVSDRVTMIHPARFLFNAGSTPKAWNEIMLADPHLKVLHYEQDCSKVFANTEIKGGIAITYRDKTQEFGSIGLFIPDETLKDIADKVKNHSQFKPLSQIAVSRTAYRFTDKMHEDFPNAIKQLTKGHAYDVSTNIFEILPQVFHSRILQDGHSYIEIIGRENNQRTSKYIREDYIIRVPNLHSWKLIIPKASGEGQLGETLSPPIIAPPKTGSTETFLSIGNFRTRLEAEYALRYLKTKLEVVLK